MVAIFLYALLSIQIISGSARYDSVFDTQKQHVQNFLDKKIPFVVKEQPYICEQQPFGKVISLENVSKIEYLDNHLLGVEINTKKHCVLDLHSNQKLKCSGRFMKIGCTMPMSQQTEKVLLWGPTDCANINVGPSSPFSKSRSHEFCIESSFIPLYRDKNQPPLIWVKHDPYDAWVNLCGYEGPLYHMSDHKAVFKSESYYDKCFFQFTEKGITLYDGKQFVFEHRGSDQKQIYCYAPDKSFAVYCVLFMYSQHRNQCDIVYHDQDILKRIPIRYKEDFVVPRSIAMNSASNSFALLCADGTIQYWSSKGHLLSIKDISAPSEVLPSFGNYCSFSPDGRRLAVMYKEHIIESNVPIAAQIAPEKLFFILFCLKHQQLLPKDIVRLVCNIFRS